LYAEERQRAILKQARRNGRVDVATLAAAFEITSETVRRDLTALERSGVVRRVHGGAIPVERRGIEPGLDARDAVMTAEKDRIAAAALEQIPDGGAILLDAGTTVGRLANLVPADRELTVVTPSLPNACALANRPGVTLMLVGGRLRGHTMASVDGWALDALKDTFVDVAFLSTSGLSVERGLTTPDTAEAMVKRAAIASARRTVLLADHTKIGDDHFARFGGLCDVDTLITDRGAEPRELDEIGRAGVKVIIV